MEQVINYNVDDYGVLRVYRGNAILFEAQDFLSTPREEIEDFIDENIKASMCLQGKLDYLREKQKVCELDKEERYELQELERELE